MSQTASQNGETENGKQITDKSIGQPLVHEADRMELFVLALIEPKRVRLGSSDFHMDGVKIYRAVRAREAKLLLSARDTTLALAAELTIRVTQS